jgi:DNA-binding beta-propeller fold protein YncE
LPSGSTNRVWVLNAGRPSATVLHGETGKPEATVAFPAAPVHIIIEDERDRAQVLRADDSLAVARLSSGEVEKTIRLGPGSGPTALVPLRDRNRLYVLNGSAGTVAAVDTDSLVIVKTVTVGAQPSWASRTRSRRARST